jgi:histidinol phosphatase-like enzyme
MMLRARNDHGICLRNSILIGDKEWDIVAANAAEVGTPVLISVDVPHRGAKPALQFTNLREALHSLPF